MSRPSNALTAPPRLWPTLQCAASLMLATLLAGTTAADASRNLGTLTSYSIQLQNVAADIDRLAASDHDLLVIEPTVATAEGQRRHLTREEVERLRSRPGGERRIVLAYLSIGEAEEYRSYWQPHWLTSPPPFLIAENCQWKRNHLVRFWDDSWKQLVFGAADSQLAQLMSAGFDGVSLDRVDVYEDIETIYPAARSQMIKLVSEIAEAARHLKPGSIVMAHNAESLLTDPGYRNVVDAVLKEDLLYGVAATDRPNTTAAIDWAERHLGLFRQEGKAVLVAEYLTDKALAEDTEVRLLERNFLPGIFPRALDGSSPFHPVRALTETEGTPEKSALACSGVWHKTASQ